MCSFYCYSSKPTKLKCDTELFSDQDMEFYRNVVPKLFSYTLKVTEVSNLHCNTLKGGTENNLKKANNKRKCIQRTFRKV